MALFPHILRACVVVGLAQGVACGSAEFTGEADGEGGGTRGTSGRTTGNPSEPTATESATSTSGPAIPDLPPGCVSEVVETNLLRPKIVLVLDQSSSMNQSWMFADMFISRWASLILTVETVLSEFNATADFGAELFPGLVSGCDADDPITVPVGPLNAATVIAGIPPGDAKTLGSTPLGSGVKVSVDHLKDNADQAPRYLVLIADGGTTLSCPGPNEVDEVVSTISNAFSSGIPTYVVGIDPLAASAELEQFAIAGGVPNDGPEAYYRADDGAALLATIGEIVAGVTGCDVGIGKVPNYPDLVKVTIGGTLYPQVEDCDLQHGWVFGQTPDSLRLCGAACAALEEFGIIQVELACP